jgi:hypothetical protein
MARSIFVVPALLAILVTGTGAGAQTADRRPALEVVLDNRAPSGAAELTSALTRTRFMFDEAGIHLSVLAQEQAVNIARSGLDRITVVVLEGAAAARLIATNERTLAFAIPPANRVYVHYERVRALARDRGVAPGWFLGAVIAHELTHVLLPRAGHTRTGLMASVLIPDPGRGLAFTREHAQLMRERLGEQTMLALK